MLKNRKVQFLRKVFGSLREDPNSNNVDVCCPNKKCKSHGSSKKKLIIELETQQYNCWVCDVSGRGVSNLVSRFKRAFLEESISIFKNSVKNSEQTAEEQIQLEMPRNFVFLAENLSHPDPDIRACLKYLEDRGVEEKDLWYFKFCATTSGRFRRRVIMPSFDSEGNLNYYVARTIEKVERMKYINSKVPKKTIIFNEFNIDFKKEVTLVEGPFDLTKADDNSVCLLGSSLKEDHALFRKIIKNNTPVCLALDPDISDKMYKIAELLNSYGICVRILDCNGYEDVGAMSKGEFLKRKASAKIFEKDHRILNLISSIRSGSII